MDGTLDQTTVGTISLLEARLLRIEHILYGQTPPPADPPAESATASLAELEHRFAQLLRRLRVYAEILKICMRPFNSLSPTPPSLPLPDSRCCHQPQKLTDMPRSIVLDKSHPTLFQSPTTSAPPADPPTQLSPDAVRATVLSYATAFPSTASALTAATADTPIPDARQSAALAALTPRMRAVEEVQWAQGREMAELRARSERAVRAWYEGGVLRCGVQLADVEGRLERVERGVRRIGRARAEGEKV